MKKINKIDLLALLFLGMTLLIMFVGLFQKSNEAQKDVNVWVKVTENSNEISGEAKKEIGETVYLNGISKPATLESAEQKDGSLFLVVRAKGELKNPIYLVFGKRIVVGQKAEVRGGFLAKGTITDISYGTQK